MALLTCKECGNQVSSTATACPQCGAPVKVAQPAQAVDLKTIIVAVAMLCVVGLYFHFRDSDSTEKTEPAQATSTVSQSPSQVLLPDNGQADAFPIKPGDVVKFAVPKLACNTRDDMLTVQTLILRDEKPKAMEYFSKDGNGRCFVLEKTNTYAVMSVNPHIKELPDYSMMRIFDMTQGSMHSVWVFAGNAIVQ